MVGIRVKEQVYCTVNQFMKFELWSASILYSGPEFAMWLIDCILLNLQLSESLYCSFNNWECVI